ncbi:PREDICTED: uncharacterized protein LOC109588418 [Amphimedon queenslandica]|uniref:Death domain-containing protein n=1 Tax=Amphimedon queenslandica TaxID=400682 RepID=A0AAN0JTB8_AMPQE|nr:PREDICTED: uncharacterized protein LOC109588418 [Amphimedon queenslandica]|eukprot:XP_019860147.1 PREDICTED: uncharacterized protein LOC109588418 [Amphimedon queenslandica]
MLLFGRDLNAIKMYMKNEFKKSKSDKELFFKFESTDGRIDSIEIHTDTENCSEGWSIRPHQENPTKVSRSTIDEYGHMNPICFPQCRFTITATPGGNTNSELMHPVTFKGIISDNTMFNIVLSMDIINPSPKDSKEIFRKHYAALSDLLMIPENIAAIAKQVYSEQLISQETLQDCMTDARRPADRAHSLLNALRVTIDQPGVLANLIKILKKYEAFRSTAEEMEHDI